MYTNINIKREAFAESKLGSLLTSIQNISFFLFIMSCAFGLIFSDEDSFYPLLFGLGVIFGIISFLLSVNGTFLWRLFPVMQDGKKVVISKLEKTAEKYEKLSFQNIHPSQIQQRIDSLKAEISELEDVLKEPTYTCVFKERAESIRAEIERINSETLKS